MQKFEELMNFGLKNEEICPNIPGQSSNCTIDKNCHFYHVTSHSYNDEPIYNFETANYRHNMLFNMARLHGCIVLLDVTKPTHSHELIMCNDFEDLAIVIRTVNSHVGKLIRTQKEKKYAIRGMRVFRERPAYQGINSYTHLLYLVKYFWENCKQTTDSGKLMPYNCFAQIEKGFVKDYNIELLEKIFNTSFDEILQKCKTLTSNEFYKFCAALYSNTDKTKEVTFFRKNH